MAEKIGKTELVQGVGKDKYLYLERTAGDARLVFSASLSV